MVQPRERASLLLKWIGGHVAESPKAYQSLSGMMAAPVPAPGAVQDFKSFATKQGVSIPDDRDADALMGRAIVRRVALVKWGDEGFLRSALSAPYQADASAAVWVGCDHGAE